MNMDRKELNKGKRDEMIYINVENKYVNRQLNKVVLILYHELLYILLHQIEISSC